MFMYIAIIIKWKEKRTEKENKKEKSQEKKNDDRKDEINNGENISNANID